MYYIYISISTQIKRVLIKGDNLDKRKIEILNAIINSYIDSSTPVGSRKLSKEYDLGVSSATIRNEMADLEDLGYLNKPHTSAGRIPSDKAYRFFVDQLIKEEGLFEYARDDYEQISKSLSNDIFNISDIYKNAVKLLADYTNCTSFLMAVNESDTKIKLIELISIDVNTVLLIIVGNKGVVDHQLIEVKESISDVELRNLSTELNKNLSGVDFGRVGKIKIILKGSLVEYSDLILNIIDRISKFHEKISSINFYYDGITNILNFKEYFDTERAKEFMNFINDKKDLINIIKESEDESNFSVIIGSDESSGLLKGNAIIKSNFASFSNHRGVIGIIGPRRMDYKNHVKNVWAVSNNLVKTIDSIVRWLGGKFRK